MKDYRTDFVLQLFKYLHILNILVTNKQRQFSCECSFRIVVSSERTSTNGTPINLFICVQLILLRIYYAKDTTQALLDKSVSYFVQLIQFFEINFK